jgi:two-component system, LytTR family, response regulator
MEQAMRIRTLLVDDEPLAREGMRMHLDDHADFEVIGESDDGESAVHAIEQLTPDVVFLDIQMPGLDGFAVLEALGDARMPHVVFVTAYDEFALRAFDAHALDYLLKPVDPERLGRTLDRLRERFREPARDPIDRRLVALLEEMRGKDEYLRRVVVRAGNRLLIVRTDEVDWIEAASNYAQLHVGQKVHTMRETMTGLESKLDPDEFIRVHRSIIVRIDRIREFEPLFQGDYLIVLRDGTRLTSSRSYRDRIRGLLR